MRRTGLSVLAAILLAGCGGETTVKDAADTGEVAVRNASVEEVARQTTASGAMRFTPGEWETAVEIVDVEIPGMPKGGAHSQALGMMKETRTVIKSCVTPEQAENPQANVFTGSNGQCSYERFSLAGGRISGVMTCKGADGSGEMRMTTDGRFDGKSFALENAMETQMGPGGSGMKMKAKVTGRRLGDCKA